MISIHAPSRERQLAALQKKSQIIFQSTLPRGSDSNTNKQRLARVLFQSTLPRGSDDQSVITLRGNINFNPRSLAGATDKREWTLAAKKFQSTLPRGSD